MDFLSLFTLVGKDLSLPQGILKPFLHQLISFIIFRLTSRMYAFDLASEHDGLLLDLGHIQMS